MDSPVLKKDFSQCKSKRDGSASRYVINSNSNQKTVQLFVRIPSLGSKQYEMVLECTVIVVNK